MRKSLWSALLLIILTSLSAAQDLRPDLGWLRWRNVGPFRGGRTRAVCGVPQQPNVFYLAQVNGGVFKTADFGHTWTPIFDAQPTASVGSIAVAPSDPNIIYVGSGEGLHRPDLSVGDGVYRSTDAGKTWSHLGLRDGQQIPQIAVDPHDPQRLYVAVAGHPYGPNEERGIFRSTNGGQTFERVLYKDENTGGADVVIDPSNPLIVYAALWEAREGPWENAAWNGTGGGIFRSSDGGSTWTQLAGGLPEGVVQANLAIAPSQPARLIATVATKSGVKLYRTDDGGATWTVITDDARPAGRIGGGDLSVPRIDPKNPDVVYVASTVSWKSTDGGKTWNALRGAPGGDDYQNVWINPTDPNIILLGSDQGAVITVNGGASWSEWYNQPTAQVYHVSADNAFPYRLCSGQQESGSVCISSRGNDGEITMREWHPVAAEEYGYVAADPLDPDIVYGGKLSRYDRRTAQAQNILPKFFRATDFRMLRTEPVVFSPVDPRALYFATNVLWKTTTAGKTWQQISPDLTRKTYDLPVSIGKYRNEDTAKAVQRGVIYAVAPSPLDVNRIWTGTDDGLVHLTSDGGKTWKDVTPQPLTPWQKVSIIDAGHFDAQTAYAAINTLRLDDLRPHIYRTHDGGTNWQEIVTGIGQSENVNAVREDPKRKGLLFAATERGVYVSFDDGDHWQSLRNNLPASSARDVIVKGDDLAVGTHGRGFWIIDNITALRQITAQTLTEPAFLFQPQLARRVRWDMNTDTPLPPDTPAGENPPDGAIIDYSLRSNASGPVTLEIKDAAGKTVRKYSSADPVPPPDPKLAIPPYWLRPPQVLATEAGTHRFLWDMHHTPLPGKPEYPIAAVPHNTAPDATSPWAMPGQYTVVLTAGGKSYARPLTVEMDPRVRTSAADLALQFRMSYQVYQDLQALAAPLEAMDALRTELEERKQQAGANADVAKAIDDFTHQLDAIQGVAVRRSVPTTEPLTLSLVSGRLGQLFGVLQEVDAAPTAQAVANVNELHAAIPGLTAKWKTLQSADLAALNAKLRAAGLAEIKVEEKPLSRVIGVDMNVRAGEVAGEE
ncbi:MAG: glycoside hydrolase [Acidobacteriota bacterium]|nr:glycoside hydrolase [Acidobacteriota bacterium]